MRRRIGVDFDEGVGRRLSRLIVQRVAISSGLGGAKKPRLRCRFNFLIGAVFVGVVNFGPEALVFQALCAIVYENSTTPSVT